MQWNQSITNDVMLSFDKTPPFYQFISALHYQYCNYTHLESVTHHLDLSQALLITAAVFIVVVDFIIAGIDHFQSHVPLQIEHITIISSHLLHPSSDHYYYYHYYYEIHCSFEHYLEHLLRQLKKIDYLLPRPPTIPPLLHNLNF